MALSIHDYQRQMMAHDVKASNARNARILQGQSASRRSAAPPNARREEKPRASSRDALVPARKEGYQNQYIPPTLPAGCPPVGTGGPYSNNALAGSYRPKTTTPDVHEILKREAFAAADPSCDSHFEKNRPCPTAVYGVSDQYMVLDSFEKVESDSLMENGILKFNFMVQGVTRNQNIGVVDKIDTVIGIQVTDFCVPLLPLDVFDPDDLVTLNPAFSILDLTANGALPLGDQVSNPQSQVPFCGRITLFLQEIGLQSYSDVDNRRHHFEFQAESVDPVNGEETDRIHLKPLKHNDFFLFTNPIQDIHGLTLNFFNPQTPIRFPPDCLYGVTASSDASQLLTFSYTDMSNLVNLDVGDRIFIRGFQAQDASGKPYVTLNDYIARPQGHIVGLNGFNKTLPSSSTSGTQITFRLNPDVSLLGLTPPIAANTPVVSKTRITVCIAKNRIRIPMRFRRIVEGLTNYITP